MPLGVGVRALFSWGWSVRHPGLSAGGAPLPLPPPSTLVGALSKGLGRILGLGELSNNRMGKKTLITSTTYAFARYLLAAGARLTSEIPTVGIRSKAVGAPTRVMQRILQHPYMRPENRRNMDLAFGVEAFGLVMAPAAIMEILLVFKDQILEIAERGALEAGARSITHIGAREGLVTIIDASVDEVIESTGGRSLYYTPATAVKRQRGGFIISFWDPRDPAAYSRMRRQAKKMEFIVPSGMGGKSTTMVVPPELEIDIRDDWRTYSMRGYGTIAALGGEDNA